MKILNLTPTYSLSSGMYHDLNKALVKAGHSVKVAFADPSVETDGIAEIVRKDGVEVLRIKTPQIQKVGLLKKGIAFLSLPFLMKRGIKKFYADEKFDLIISLAPPITFAPVSKWAKRKFGCPVFLMQKDIFPQNAVDLGIMKKYSPLYFYFRSVEKSMLKSSDKIGCMSEGNIEYIRRHNPYIPPEDVVYFPNTINIPPRETAPQSREIRQKYNIPQDACVFLFGGNIGLPQYTELLKSAMSKFAGRRDIYFLVIGSGTRAKDLEKFISEKKISNAAFHSYMPRDDYEKIAMSCDVGLVILSPKFTIPNYPSKTLSYMATSLPILAATDTNTDYRNLVQTQAKCGLWVDASDANAFAEAVEKLANSPELRSELGENGRKFLEENFDVSLSVGIIEKLFGLPK